MFNVHDNEAAIAVKLGLLQNKGYWDTIFHDEIGTEIQTERLKNDK